MSYFTMELQPLGSQWEQLCLQPTFPSRKCLWQPVQGLCDAVKQLCNTLYPLKPPGLVFAVLYSPAVLQAGCWKLGKPVWIQTPWRAGNVSLFFFFLILFFDIWNIHNFFFNNWNIIDFTQWLLQQLHDLAYKFILLLKAEGLLFLSISS